MLKWLFIAALLALAPLGAARAQTCATFPNTLTNGTTADANQVMANFNTIRNCANTALAPLAAPAFTGNLTVSSGNVGIGTTTPTDILALVPPATAVNGFVSVATGYGGPYFVGHEVGSGYSTASPVFKAITDNLSGPSNVYFAGVTGSTTNFYVRADGQGYFAGSILLATTSPTYLLTVNGSAGGTSAWNVTSDARLKTHVVEIKGALKEVMQLRGVTFDWKSPDDRSVGKSLSLPVGEKQMGFIAQEVAAVAPEAVNLPKDPATDVYSMKDGALVPLLVEAIKAQQAEISELRERVAALAARVARGQGASTGR